MKTFKWTEEQKKALRGSIRKWTKVYNGTGADNGADNCPCCKMWNTGEGCGGCPVNTFTGEDECYGTPYRDPECGLPYTDASKAELNFLKAVYLAGGGK